MKQIRESKFSKIVVYYLVMMMVLQFTSPMQMYALTSGPTQPEFNSFTPISTSDMVDLASGDFNYNIPVMDVGGYPINLAYNSGITMDQEASWVGLGWNLSVGQIERQIRGLPDDFRGDEMVYENNLRKNRTVGMNLGVNGALTGIDALKLGVGLGVESNNYEGISFKPSFGIGFQFNDNVSVGLDFTSSLDGGATVSPRVGISKNIDDKGGTTTSLGSSISLGFNSRKGIENLNVSASVSQKGETKGDFKNDKGEVVGNTVDKANTSNGVGGSVSFNNLSFTPAKRIGFKNENFSFNAALGGALFGVEGQVHVTGYGSYQTIADEYRNRKEKAYGYENTEYKKPGTSGVFDFNRENEKTVTENTLSLPVTNYTYDLYTIDGQDVSGMFRSYRSKVSHVYNDEVVDNGNSVSIDGEVGIGNLLHVSSGFKSAPSVTSTGGWVANNNVLPYFTEYNTDKKTHHYEPTTFKMVGAMNVDPETIYRDKLFTTEALRIDIAGNKKNTYTTPYTFGTGKTYGNSEIKRTKRFLRSQLIQKISANEGQTDKFIIKNDHAKPHHTAGVKVLKTDGSTFVYGEAAYNIKKVEATFDVSGKVGNNNTGLVGYTGALDSNGNGTSDQYVNKVTTPAHAHSYLLSSVLSSDYEDVDNNGPTINDLGTFTKFEYTKIPIIYSWRVPFQANTATYNEGLISKKDDQKGNYLYGKKELKYLDKIVTKTHVAFFDIESRKDAIGSKDDAETGGPGNARMQKLTSIRLYSRQEVTNPSGVIFDPNDVAGSQVKPIKTAHFVYSYDLCKGIPNNEKNNAINNAVTSSEISNNGGKLTLKKVYFTYRGSNMGKYTPYTFNYDVNENGTPNNESLTSGQNPNYNSKEFDIWGNYKPNAANSGTINGPLSNTEFPFVNQDKTITNGKTQADRNTETWNLKTVSLPSGGKITIETESDDYRYVQNKKAMQMYQVVGVGNNGIPTSNNQLYNGSTHTNFLYVKLTDENITNTVATSSAFVEKYLSDNLSKPIQFKFMVNMTDNISQYEFVSGYFKIGNADHITVTYNPGLGGSIAALPVQLLTRDKGRGQVNPITKTGWGFGRMFLNRLTCGRNDDPTATDFKSIVENLKGSLQIMSEIFKGPNGYLQGKGCARLFKPLKSYIRLENSDDQKYGGGIRVKSIKLSDNWTKMLEGNQGGTNTNDMEYGQLYSYEDVNGKSSGVATFEPNMCAENPFVEPFYNNEGNYAETIAAPKEMNYVEKPFGVNFFPAPKVTYSRVTVKNLDRSSQGIKKHATGSVVTTHFTSYNFPTKVNYTSLKMINGITPDDQIGNMIASIIVGGNINVRNLLTMAQGYSIETNDMNGKIERQEVYNESNSKISSVEYKYNVDDRGDIDSNMTTIDEKGKVEKRLIGVDYDVINDFNRSFARTDTRGFKANLNGFLIPMVPVPIPIFIPTVFPESCINENEMRTAVTTKHVHKTGMLVEKIATDLGSTVSTKNRAWDANTGDVLLTETVNEYGDHYFSFNYPAYWMYDGMGLASHNIGIEGKLNAKSPIAAPNSDDRATNNPYFELDGYTDDLSNIFHFGDELLVTAPSLGLAQSSNTLNVNLAAEQKYWIVGFQKNGQEKNIGVLLMDRNGEYLNKCLDINSFSFKIMRSGNRNLQASSMASVTSMINPIDLNNDGTFNNLTKDTFLFDTTSANPRIINASAVEYNEFWLPQAEHNLPYYPAYDLNRITTTTRINPLTGLSVTTTTDLNYINPDGLPKYPYNVKVNPYVWNIKGDWRAKESFAYLTGRNTGDGTINNPRNEGFFTSFSPFYQIDASGKWNKNIVNWTGASSITQFSPFGQELENKDALNRHSSAQFGYQHKLPMAVASNSKYQQIGYEGFEEVKTNGNAKHFGFTGHNENVSTKYSHTGKASMKVPKGMSSLLTKPIFGRIQELDFVTCPTVVDQTPSQCYQSKTKLEGLGYVNVYGYRFRFAEEIEIAEVMVPPHFTDSPNTFVCQAVGNDLILKLNETSYLQGHYGPASVYVLVRLSPTRYRTIVWNISRHLYHVGGDEWQAHGGETTSCISGNVMPGSISGNQ